MILEQQQEEKLPKHITCFSRKYSQCTLVQITGTAEAICVQARPCSPIHSHRKITAYAEVRLAAGCPSMQLANLYLSLLEEYKGKSVRKAADVLPQQHIGSAAAPFVPC